MFDKSIINKSGQMWKAVLSFIVLICGAITMRYGFSHGYLSIPIVSGFALMAFSLVFPCIAIRCSLCGARWVWLAFSGQNSNHWLFWLFAQSECPVCKGAARPPNPVDNSALPPHS